MANTSPQQTPGPYRPEERGGPYYHPEAIEGGTPATYPDGYASRQGEHHDHNSSSIGSGRRSWDELAVAEDEEAWRARTRVLLTPIAAPSIMGLFGFMIATGMVGAWQAGWYGTATTPFVLLPFAFMAGGVLQSVAAFFSFRARDGVAVAVHTTWGSFWMGWGLLQVLALTHALPAIAMGSVNSSFAMWWVMLTVVTMSCALASSRQSSMLFLVLSTLAAGSALTAVGFFSGSLGIDRAGGWLFVVSAAAAWLTATAMTLEHAFEGKTIIPLGKWSKEANIPGRRATRPLQYPSGMPGVRVGQ
jgi:succinate-acetate transporter protein